MKVRETERETETERMREREREVEEKDEDEKIKVAHSRLEFRYGASTGVKISPCVWVRVGQKVRERKKVKRIDNQVP